MPGQHAGPIAVLHAGAMNEDQHLSLCSRFDAAPSTDIMGQTGTVSDTVGPQFIIAIWVPF